MNFCTGWIWFFFIVTIVIMHITLHVIINLQIVISGLSGFFMNFEFSTYLFITSVTPSTGRKSPFIRRLNYDVHKSIRNLISTSWFDDINVWVDVKSLGIIYDHMIVTMNWIYHVYTTSMKSRRAQQHS